MKEIVSTLTSKGQLTVPAEIRRTLGLKQGDKVIFQVDGQEVKLTSATSRLDAGYQSIPALTKPRTWKELEALVADERAEAYFQKMQAGNA